jgi:hypothetical protein
MRILLNFHNVRHKICVLNKGVSLNGLEGSYKQCPKFSHTHTYNPSIFSIQKTKLDAKCPHDHILRATSIEGPIS